MQREFSALHFIILILVFAAYTRDSFDFYLFSRFFVHCHAQQGAQAG